MGSVQIDYVEVLREMCKVDVDYPRWIAGGLTNYFDIAKCKEARKVMTDVKNPSSVYPILSYPNLQLLFSFFLPKNSKFA